MKNDFLNELVTLRPELKEFYESKQYELSLEIIDIMAEKNLEEHKVVVQLKLDLTYFNRLTSGDNTINVTEYQSIIEQLKSL